MNAEFQRCLNSGRLSPFPQGPALAAKELSTARNDLADAKASLTEGRPKWATIQGYYAMFHAARALVYSRGYREKSHYCLAVALQALFVDEKRLEVRAVRDFLNAMNLREAADYEADFSKKGGHGGDQGGGTVYWTGCPDTLRLPSPPDFSLPLEMAWPHDAIAEVERRLEYRYNLRHLLKETGL